MLGAVLPSSLYAAIAVAGYLVEVALLIGADRLRLLPVALSAAMVALIPTYAVLEAAIAGFISSRVRTYQSAQALSGLAMLPVMAALFGLAFAMREWSAWLLPLVIALLIAADVVLVPVGAATWRREEVLARR